MKINIYLVKDEYSTVQNFRCLSKASSFASTNKNFTVERIEIELPQYKEFKKEFDKLEEEITPNSDKLDSVVNKHIIDIYEKSGRNKSKTARILGVTEKTVYNKLGKLGVV